MGEEAAVGEISSRHHAAEVQTGSEESRRNAIEALLQRNADLITRMDGTAASAGAWIILCCQQHAVCVSMLRGHDLRLPRCSTVLQDSRQKR